MAEGAEWGRRVEWDADSPLTQCAGQLVAAAPRGYLGKSYRLHRDQRAALLGAVEARVARDTGGLTSLVEGPWADRRRRSLHPHAARLLCTDARGVASV